MKAILQVFFTMQRNIKEQSRLLQLKRDFISEIITPKVMYDFGRFHDYNSLDMYYENDLRDNHTGLQN